MKTIALILLLLSNFATAEESIVIHAASYHPQVREYNEFNPGVGYRAYDDSGMFATIGSYRNSLSVQSVYAGGGFRVPVSGSVAFGVVGGFISGYTTTSVVFTPELAVRLARNVSLNVTYFPQVEKLVDEVVGFSFEVQL